MPTVNAYFRKEAHGSHIVEAADPLRAFIAQELSHSAQTLIPDEVTIRIIRTLGNSMIGDVEMDMFAAPSAERIERQDEICANVSIFAMQQMPELQAVKTWLILSELGHSF